MNGGAPYQFDLTLSADDALEFVVELEGADGGDFPWSDNAIEYAAAGEGAQACRLTQWAGIIVDPTLDQALIRLPAGMAPGVYTHAGRSISNADGQPTLLFDGVLTILRGAF